MSASNLVAAPSDDALVNDCDIAYGQPSPEDVVPSRKLRLICLSSAGYTRYDTPAFRKLCQDKQIVVCNASGVYDEPCAQHLLAFMLAAARQLPEAAEVHAATRMKIAASSLRKPRSREAAAGSSETAADSHWPTTALRGQSRLLSPNQVVLLVGYGAIAKRIAELLVPFGMNVHAYRRSPRGDEIVPTHPIGTLNAHLPTADHVVNILPLTDATRNFFDTQRLATFKPGAHYYNIGRGDTNDQAALVQALVSGQIAQAYLDVTSPEPLPITHPLWLAPHCHITPHTAGGTHDEAGRQVAHFADNLKRFASGQPLRDRIF